MNILAVFILISALSGVLSGPLHASCKIDWQFGMECDAVMTKLVNQIKAMGGKSGCANGGEKCLYELTSSTSAQITAKHTTPVKGYVDDLTFTFKGGKTSNPCQVHGYSTSETWYAVLDFGTNYCNLENLIIGAGLNSTSGYSETTSDSICTQYSSADCEKY
ncbi:hypothetical protein LOTGIDRAFT_143540 [Lottia gigantea]|uniref:Uncharacterized protein n=1 Tax=Lottia gigantea TaxID=225164 RepID=V4AQH7_LOTGI|nr:hypothetical protein LOTGIDRAFT_143540 [Lottia gigantea]ESO97070.1 hypothetical protein LOTGIDRAFT_143540 [Lottia gigantea]